MPDLFLDLFARITALPWYVGMPGIAVIALLVWSAFWSLLTLRIPRAIVRLILAFAVFVILSQAGSAISQLVGGAPPGS